MAISQPQTYGVAHANAEMLKAAAFTAAFADNGYLTGEGLKSRKKVAWAIYDQYAEKVVHDQSERGAKAIFAGALTAAVFPNAVVPDDWANQDDPKLAEDIWKMLRPYVVATAGATPGSELSKLIKPNGLAVCHVKLGDERDTAIYITDSPECVRIDMTNPVNLGMSKVTAKSVHYGTHAIELFPEHGPEFLRSYEKIARSAIAQGREGYQLAMESVNTDHADDGSSANGAPEDEGE